MAIYTLFFNFFLFLASGQCLGNQQTLLTELKNNLTFNFDVSTKLVTWNQSVNCCSWGGITCSDGHVVGLNLANEFISSGLDNSSSLFCLSYLQSLNLGNNDFNSSGIPLALGKLTNLRYLNLSSAKLKGQIPLVISHLTRLVVLDLSFNYYLELKNPNLNMLIQNLSKLAELYLDGISISSHDDNWCQALSSSLPNLRVLGLSYCGLFGPIDSSLRNLQLLSVIDLSGNHFGTAVPEFFGDFKNLTFLDLSMSWLNGIFPEKIFQVSTLQELYLPYNFILQGSLPEFPPNGSLRTMELALTNFSGILPESIGNLKMLSTIDLYDCNFTGSIPKSMVRLRELVYLDMSQNHLSGSIPVFSMAKNLTKIYLAGNNLFGHITFTQWEKLLNLEVLDLSFNFLDGNVPISFFSIPSLKQLMLCHNQFSGRLDEFSNTSSFLLEMLDLSDNNLEGLISKSIFELQGPLPTSIESSRTHQLKIPDRFISFSNNMFSGSIPKSICNISNLRALDLSNNIFGGTIPQCLLQRGSLGVLNLRSNNLSGPISNVLPNSCKLQILILNGNHLVGELPKSLSSCVKLEVLDIGNNNIEGTFSFYLKNASMLKLLILRSNKFYGIIPHLGHEGTWPMLQILDVALNNFNGRFPTITISNWTTMISGKDLVALELQYVQYVQSHVPRQGHSQFPEMLKLLLYKFSITITTKGSTAKLVKILTIYTNLDFSCNNFDGPIPKEIGELKMLYALNLSHNAFWGPIPPSLGKLTQLESLDLSSNNLIGKIPMQLADGLIFLSMLNLSFNQLE